MSPPFSPAFESAHATTAVARAQAKTPPPQRRPGRFADTRRTPVLRRAYAWLCRCAPSVATQLAYRQLATPPRAPIGKWPLSLREQTRSHRVRCGGGDIAVYEWGHGPAVLLVHGWGSNALHMGRLAQHLVAAGFRVVALDAPAHGQSSGRTTDMVQFAAAIAAVARETGPFHAVIGHSFGAAMAVFAVRYWNITATRLVLISSFHHCNWFVEMFAQHVGLTPGVLQGMRDLFVQRYGGRLDWDHMSVVEMARRSRLPALLVHDESDDEIPFSHALALADALPGAQFKATRGLGHHRVVRNPEVVRRVVAFLTH